MGSRRAILLLAAMTCLASPARGQVSEMQAGLIVGSGPGQTDGPMGGLVFGVAAGRLVYVGARATRYGETWTDGGTGDQVTNHSTAVAVDLAAVVPLGPLELMAGASTGLVRYSQRVGSATTSAHATEFLVAPSLAAELHAGPVALIPELQYQYSDRSRLPFRVRHTGWLASLRVVVPWEIGRIRT